MLGYQPPSRRRTSAREGHRVRPERHNPHSIATLRITIARYLLAQLPCCPFSLSPPPFYAPLISPRRTDNTTPGAGLSGSNPIGVGTIVVDDGDNRRRRAVCSPPPFASGHTSVLGFSQNHPNLRISGSAERFSRAALRSTI